MHSSLPFIPQLVSRFKPSCYDVRVLTTVHYWIILKSASSYRLLIRHTCLNIASAVSVFHFLPLTIYSTSSTSSSAVKSLSSCQIVSHTYISQTQHSHKQIAQMLKRGFHERISFVSWDVLYPNYTHKTCSIDSVGWSHEWRSISGLSSGQVP